MTWFAGSTSVAGTGAYHLLLLSVNSMEPSPDAAVAAFLPLVAYRLINATMSAYKMNAVLQTRWVRIAKAVEG